MSSTMEPISSTASHAVYVVCFISGKLEHLWGQGEHWRAVIGNDANKLVARHFNSGTAHNSGKPSVPFNNNNNVFI
jgi:hypothetical protein